MNEHTKGIVIASCLMYCKKHMPHPCDPIPTILQYMARDQANQYIPLLPHQPHIVEIWYLRLDHVPVLLHKNQVPYIFYHDKPSNQLTSLLRVSLRGGNTRALTKFQYVWRLPILHGFKCNSMSHIQVCASLSMKSLSSVIQSQVIVQWGRSKVAM
jgi:hypothetical protein